MAPPKVAPINTDSTVAAEWSGSLVPGANPYLQRQRPFFPPAMDPSVSAYVDADRTSQNVSGSKRAQTAYTYPAPLLNIWSTNTPVVATTSSPDDAANWALITQRLYLSLDPVKDHLDDLQDFCTRHHVPPDYFVAQLDYCLKQYELSEILLLFKLQAVAYALKNVDFSGSMVDEVAGSLPDAATFSGMESLTLTRLTDGRLYPDASQKLPAGVLMYYVPEDNCFLVGGLESLPRLGDAEGFMTLAHELVHATRDITLKTAHALIDTEEYLAGLGAVLVATALEPGYLDELETTEEATEIQPAVDENAKPIVWEDDDLRLDQQLTSRWIKLARDALDGTEANPVELRQAFRAMHVFPLVAARLSAKRRELHAAWFAAQKSGELSYPGWPSLKKLDPQAWQERLTLLGSDPDESTGAATASGALKAAIAELEGLIAGCQQAAQWLAYTDPEKSESFAETATRLMEDVLIPSVLETTLLSPMDGTIPFDGVEFPS